MWEKIVRESTDTSSQHRSDEERGTEDAARIAGSIAGSYGDQLQQHQKQHQFQCHMPVQGIADKSIADAENLWNKPSEYADQQSARRRLQPLRLERKSQESFSHPE